MAIYFLRHVKTQNNIEKILTGRCESEILPNQEILYFNPNLHFDKVYCSSSKRCKDTLDLMPKEFFGDVYYTDILLERSIGILEGMKRENAIEKYPQLFVEKRIGTNFLIPDGESIEEVKMRVDCLVQEMLRNRDNTNYLICSHNQTLKVIYSVINNIDITDEYWRNTDFPNGTIVKV